jgi:hypothetical protein
MTLTDFEGSTRLWGEQHHEAMARALAAEPWLPPAPLAVRIANHAGDA